MQVNQYTNSDHKNADEQEKIGKITGVFLYRNYDAIFLKSKNAPR